MARTLMTGILGLALTVAAAAEMQDQGPGDAQHLTRSQAKTLAKQAHTPEQYSVLAEYYGRMQNDYLKKAAGEKAEWERRSQMTAALAQKYPRPADSSRNRYEYFMNEATQFEALKAKYSKMAAPAGAKTE
jgi:hypothetical protein